MVAADFLQDPQVRQWLDGVEPTWTLLSLDSLRALRQKPSAVQSTIRIANDLSTGEIAGSPVARNTLILLRKAERDGLVLTATCNLSRVAVAEICELIECRDAAAGYERDRRVPQKKGERVIRNARHQECPCSLPG